jgi:type IV pilus assembly protein PilE
MRRLNSGFSLLELLIALAIIGILAAICYPSYQQYVLKTYRAEAVAQLLQVANAQEHHLADYASYAPDMRALGISAADLPQRYKFSIAVSEDGQAFELTAVAQGAQLADSECTTLTLNQYGQRNAFSPQNRHCWD